MKKTLPTALAAWCHAQRAIYFFGRAPDAERDRARRHIALALATDNEHPLVLAVLGTASTLIGDLDLADLLIEKCLTIDPDCSMAELHAVLLARDLRDGEKAIIGTNSDVQVAACNLARTRQAPTLWWVSGPGGMVNCNEPVIRSTARPFNWLLPYFVGAQIVTRRVILALCGDEKALRWWRWHLRKQGNKREERRRHGCRHFQQRRRPLPRHAQ